MPTSPSSDQTPVNVPVPPTLSNADGARSTHTPGSPAATGVVLSGGTRPLPEYELIRLLGRGGFGEVWQAKGPGGFDVALKFVRLGEKVGEVELRALELMKGLRHAHLLPMFGAWQQDGFLIVAMELADGTLLDRLNQAQGQGLAGIPQAELFESMREAAKGLDFLNEACPTRGGGAAMGIQHKDVKPQNLLVVGGSVKVADFGLAKLLEHTVTAASGGLTPAYAPPEFFSGQATRWSDQYSLAVTYCQMRGGRLPFEGNAAQVMAGHLTREPVLDMLPEEERPAVARALAKEPEERWPTCGAFVEALHTPASRGSPPVPAQAQPAASVPKRPAAPTAPRPVPVRRGSRRLMPWLVGTLALAVAVVLYVVWKSGGDGPREGQPFTNSVGMKFVWIEPGHFRMGSPPGEAERDNKAETPHRVTLTKGFHLGVHLVTQHQWEQVMGKDANKSLFIGKDDDEKKRLPVDSVRWKDCQEFCRKLGVLEGRRYRLPSEAEWEYACRAGTTTAFWWGDSITTDQANYDGTSTYGKEGKKGEYRQKPTPVDFFKANPGGLHDMHGNLWQWCEDAYGSYGASAIKDPVNAVNGPDDRVVRGGSWDSQPGWCRAAYRRRHPPGNPYRDVGCRVVVCLD